MLPRIVAVDQLAGQAAVEQKHSCNRCSWGDRSGFAAKLWRQFHAAGNEPFVSLQVSSIASLSIASLESGEGEGLVFASRYRKASLSGKTNSSRSVVNLLPLEPHVEQFQANEERRAMQIRNR